jgi:hypothetical protein
MKLTINLKPTEKQKKEQIKKCNALLQVSEITFIHFDSDGKITEISNQKFNFINSDESAKM